MTPRLSGYRPGRSGLSFGLPCAVVVLLLAAGLSEAAWPTFRYDNARSGGAPEGVATPLSLQWTYTPRHPPRPAWPEPGKEMHRMPFDYAFHVAVADGLVFFGSSADHKVYALDLATGRERWSFFTEGPVRFAPAAANGRLYAASDDGCLYCLSSENGKLLWRFRAGPRDERLAGNEQVISRWPARSGVLVDGETVYVTAGMWSPDGVYVYALRAEDGSVIWRNDTCNEIYMGLPHSAMEGIAGVAPQGYMALWEDTLLVPNGRAEPAAFDAKTGELLFCQNASTKLHHAGGSWIFAADGLVFAGRRPVQADRHVFLGEADPCPGEGLIAWDCRTGEQKLALVGKHRAVIHGGTMFPTGDGTISAIGMDALRARAAEFYASGKRDPEIPKEHDSGGMFVTGSPFPWFTSKVVPIYPRPAEWETPLGRTYALILAGDTLIAGGRGSVTAIDAGNGESLWEASVEGQARGLAVAEGRLLVSTSTGQILCFGPDRVTNPSNIAPRATAPEIPPDVERQARAILRGSGVEAGYCLMLGVGDGKLACALAQESDLVIYCIEPNPKKAATARRLLDDADLYGVRVTVHEGPLSRLPYADYLADLIIVDEEVAGALGRCRAKELYRVLRPYGGVAHVRPEPPTTDTLADVSAWLKRGDVPASEIQVDDGAVTIVRGPLPDAGEWTHPYADTGRSGASDDRLVRLPLRMLWFGKPGPARMVSRHWRSPTPLCAKGRLFVAGEHHLMAVNAYNGRELWSRELPDVGRYSARYRGGDIVTDGDYVYALQGTECLRLDARTGRTSQTYQPPPEAANVPLLDNPIDTSRGGQSKAQPVPNEVQWEFLAVTDELVIGSVGVPNFSWSWWPEAYPESKYVFALQKEDRRPAWVYTADRAVSPNAISIAHGRVFLIDRTSKAEVERARRRGAETPVAATLRALDLSTGEPVWETSEQLEGTLLWQSSDVLLVTGGSTSSAYSTADGSLLWSARLPGQPEPVIIGDTIYLYPRAFDLRTGEWKTRPQPLTGEPENWLFQAKGGCGTLSGCPTTLFYRSGAAGFCDLAGDSGAHWLGQARSSCWVNMIPAGGLLLMPEGASSCTCPYNFQTSLALVPDQRNENWSLYSAEPRQPTAGIRRLAVNFGAVGDQRDTDGTLWLGYPRPFRPGTLMLPMVTDRTVRYQRRNADDLSIERADTLWVYTSAAYAPERIDLDLMLDRPATAAPCAPPPRIDGRLDDACWDGRDALIFTNDTHAIDPNAVAYLRSDNANLYVAFRREASVKDGAPLPWTMTTTGQDAPVWNDDSFNVRLWDPVTVAGVYIYVSASGATFDGLTNRQVANLVGTDAKWNGEWQHAVAVEPTVWTAELAVPWQTLDEADITKDRLRTYLESTNQTGIGPKTTHYKHRTWARLHLFGRVTPVAFEELPAAEERTCRVVLHFAELEDVAPGERVFDVKINGQTVIHDLDVVKEAGGSNTALVKTIENVAARDALSFEFVPHGGKPAIISGLEVYEWSQE